MATPDPTIQRVDSDPQDEFPMFKRKVSWESSDLKPSTSSSALLYSAEEESEISQLKSVFVAYDQVDTSDARFISRIPTIILLITLLIVPPGYVFGIGCWAIPLPPPVSPLNVWHILFIVHTQLVTAYPISMVQGVWAHILLRTSRVWLQMLLWAPSMVLTWALLIQFYLFPSLYLSIIASVTYGMCMAMCFLLLPATMRTWKVFRGVYLRLIIIVVMAVAFFQGCFLFMWGFSSVNGVWYYQMLLSVGYSATCFVLKAFILPRVDYVTAVVPYAEFFMEVTGCLFSNLILPEIDNLAVFFVATLADAFFVWASVLIFHVQLRVREWWYSRQAGRSAAVADDVPRPARPVLDKETARKLVFTQLDSIHVASFSAMTPNAVIQYQRMLLARAFQSGMFTLEPELERDIQEQYIEHGILAAFAEIASPILFFIIACMCRWSFNAAYFQSFSRLTDEVFQRSMLYSLGNLGVAVLSTTFAMLYLSRRCPRARIKEVFHRTVRCHFWLLLMSLIGFLGLQVTFLMTHYGVYPFFFHD